MHSSDELYRDFDPARGPFEPSGEHAFPPKTEDNPQGTRHINKTYQDQQPVKDRKRVQEAQERAKSNV